MWYLQLGIWRLNKEDVATLYRDEVTHVEGMALVRW